MGAAGPVGAAPGLAALGAAPELAFAVAGVEALRPAAAPTLRFALAIDAGGAPIRSVVLDVQIRISATQRAYATEEQEALAGLFGAPSRWGETLRSLPWLQATLVVPPFDGTTVAQLDVPCTYDFEVGAAQYLAALRDGTVPLELLFSGTVFDLSSDGRLRASRISWEREAACSLPVAVWRAAIDTRFPGSAWVRLDRTAFDRLAAFRARRALTSWEATMDALIDGAEGRA
ncbi:MAG: hypothetical protein JWQ48_2041 [Conexibacter sp.]|jgi:hypothetical protein|nr:hypothetical protein [Conexibacter sp.]